MSHKASQPCLAFSLCHLYGALVEGLGIAAGPEYFDFADRRLAKGGYAGLKDLLDNTS